VKEQANGTLLADWSNLASDGPIGGYAVSETGAYVLEALKQPQEWIGNKRCFMIIINLSLTRLLYGIQVKICA
jgi:hypothetical protein